MRAQLDRHLDNARDAHFHYNKDLYETNQPLPDTDYFIIGQEMQACLETFSIVDECACKLFLLPKSSFITGPASNDGWTKSLLELYKQTKSI